MSVGRLGKATNWGDDVIGQKILDERQAQWGEIPGKIVSFDPQTQTATIQPLYKPRFNGKAVDMPQLLEVPVRFARAGGGMAVTFPVKEGDHVTLRPQMRSTENYHAEADGAASDARSFNLSDMEAFLEGGESLKDAIPGLDSMNAHFRFNAAGTYGIRGSADGKFKIEGSQGDIMDLLTQVVELLADDTLIINYGSSQGSGHALEHQSQYAEIAAKLRAMTL